MHAPPPHMPPATPPTMHAPCHACPPCYAHPCYACPLTCHACLPATHAPLAMHTPCHAHSPATHAPCHACPPMDRMTDACENITFPQLLLRTVMNINMLLNSVFTMFVNLKTSCRFYRDNIGRKGTRIPVLIIKLTTFHVE